MSISATRRRNCFRLAGPAFAGLILFLSGCVVREDVDVPFHRYLDQPPEIRVLIAEESSRIPLYAPAGSHVQSGSKTTLCSSPRTVVVSAKGGRAWIGDKDTDLSGITFIPPEGEYIQINNKPYAGLIRVTATGDSLSIVNTVSVEDYVAGVVAGEMPLLWRMDALCAQAVAARSYVLNEKQKWADERPFDVYADERSQVYAGVPNDPKAFQAASDTRGAILVWNWKLFPTFYHSSCAGRTRRAEPFLIARHIPPLAGTTCSWCSDVDTAWRRPIPSAELQKLLNLPKPIDMVALTGDGKIVITLAGSKTNFSPDEFRAFVGPRIIRSPDFTVKKSGNMWHFEGRGFGHGVGMCQHGARGMALKGYKWPSIVRHYYPGAQIVRVY